MFSLVPICLLSAALPLSFSQDSGSGSGSGSYVGGLVDHLNTLGFTGAANVLTRVNSTGTGQQWLSELPNGNYTVFVPNNEALQNLSSGISDNDELLAKYLSYHFVHGSFVNTTTNSTGGGGGGGQTSSVSSESSSSTSSESSSATPSLFAWYRRQDSGDGSSGGQMTNPELQSGIYPNDTIGRTLLNSSDLVMLEGNKSQVLAWTRSGPTSNITIFNQATNFSQSSQNITVTNSSLFQNLFINTIDGVILPPGNLSTALTATNATSFLSLAQQVNVASPSGGNTTVLDALSSLHGFTLFVPTNDAIQNAEQVLNGLQSNETAVMALLGNHIINGTTIYSPDLQNATASGSPVNFTTAAGETLTVSSNSTGLFVQNQNSSSAQIVRPDVLLSNGVFHIIDHVLVETDSNPEQATSAVLSASSVASAMSSTDTLPIGGGFTTLSA